MKLLCASVVLTIASVTAWVSSPSSPTSSSAASCRAEASRLYSNYQYEQGVNGNGGWNGDSFHERTSGSQWNGGNNNEYEGQDGGYNNNNADYNSNNQFYEPNQQQKYDARYQYNSQNYQGEPNQEYQGGQHQYQQQPNQQRDYNNGQQQYDPQYQDGSNQGYYNDQFYPPPEQGYNREQPYGAYGDGQPNDAERYPSPSRMNGGDHDNRGLSRPPTGSLLDEMFDDPFFDDPFFDSFFSMPTPFSLLTPFYRSRRRRGGNNNNMVKNSNFQSAFSMLDRMREKMEEFSMNGGGGFLQRTEESNRILVNKAERYLNDDLPCRMALGVGNEDRIRLGPILGSSSSMAYASVWDNNREQRRQERRNQRNLQIAVDNGPDPRMEAVVMLTAFENDEIQSLTMLTRDGREISVPVIGRDNGGGNNYNGNFDDGGYLNEDRRDGPPPPGVIDAEVVEQRR